MKKGISLIVLVITIIIMIIIAGAIILSLNSSNVTNKAKYATVASDRANLQAELATEYATHMADNAGDATGFEYSRVTNGTLPDGFTVVDNTVYYTKTLAGAPATPDAWYSPVS